MNLKSQTTKRKLRRNNLQKLIEKRLKEKEWPAYVRAYAHALLNPKTMAATMRRILKEKKKISDVDLRELIKKEGYNPDGGAYSAILYVLDVFTGEIKRIGRGKNKVYVWVGSDRDT